MNAINTEDPVANSLAELVSEVKGIGDVRQDIAVLRETLAEIEQKGALGAHRGGAGGRPETLGQRVLRAHDFKAWHAGGALGKLRIAPETKAVTVELPPQQIPGIVGMERRPLSLRDLIPVIGTTAGSVSYIRQSSRTLAAAMVAEGALKPESDLGFEMVEAPVRTIAHWITVSRQALDDGGQSLATAIDGELMWGLRVTEDGQLLSGDGTGQNLLGLIPSATAYETARTVTGDTAIDVAAHALAQLVETTGIEATGVVLNPADWAAMSSSKDTTGAYLAGSPFQSGPRTLWGKPVVLTPSMAAGSFLVGAFGLAAAIYERLPVEILISADHADFFIRNLLAVRAETRETLTVSRPALLVTGAFPA